MPRGKPSSPKTKKPVRPPAGGGPKGGGKKPTKPPILYEPNPRPGKPPKKKPGDVGHGGTKPGGKKPGDVGYGGKGGKKKPGQQGQGGPKGPSMKPPKKPPQWVGGTIGTPSYTGGTIGKGKPKNPSVTRPRPGTVTVAVRGTTKPGGTKPTVNAAAIKATAKKKK